MSIMRDDPDFGKRLQKKVQEIKEDKQNLLNVADEYGKQYQQEILEGTELRAKLLTEGSSKGMSEEQIMASYGKFVPTVYTPILNLLYFLLRESDGSELYQRRNAINERLVKSGKLYHGEGDMTEEELSDLLSDKDKSVNRQTVDPRRQKLNQQLLEEQKQRPREEDVTLKETPDMVNYLYGNITLDTFNKIKKLKALSKSPNEQEAFQAYRKAVELCKQHNLDFDRIPCYVNSPK